MPNPPAARADEVAECPPHYWLIETRTQVCKKCGVERPLPVVESARWPRQVARAGAATPAEGVPAVDDEITNDAATEEEVTAMALSEEPDDEAPGES